MTSFKAFLNLHKIDPVDMYIYFVEEIDNQGYDALENRTKENVMAYFFYAYTRWVSRGFYRGRRSRNNSRRQENGRSKASLLHQIPSPMART